MKKKKIVTITVLLFFVLVFILLPLCLFWPRILEKIQVARTRTEAAYQMPNFSGEVTDVRVTVVQRDINANAIYGDLFDESGNVYQLYYGYRNDGKWIDIPHENYDLRGLKNSGKCGIDAAGNDHVVTIGPYVLIALSARGNANDTIVDTVNSEVFSITKYYHSETPSFFFRENMLAYDTEEYRCWISPSFLRWHFITLKVDDIPQSYSVTIFSRSQETNELLDERTYTYEDIMTALNRE